MIESSYPPGSIQRYVSTQVLPAFKETTPKVVGGIVAVVALTIIGHFSMNLMLGGLDADGLGERVAVSFVECLWGLLTVSMVVMAIALVLLIPVGCNEWFQDWKKDQLKALNGPDVETAQAPLVATTETGSSAVVDA